MLVDLAVHRLPDRLTLPAAAGVVVLLGVAAVFDGGFDRWWRVVLAGLAVALFFAATTVRARPARVRPRRREARAELCRAARLVRLGRGAARLMAGLVASALVSIALLIAGRVRWSSHLPFGPFLIFGTLLALILVGPSS